MWYEAKFYFFDRHGDSDRDIVDKMLIYAESRMEAWYKASEYAEEYGYDDCVIDKVRF